MKPFLFKMSGNIFKLLDMILLKFTEACLKSISHFYHPRAIFKYFRPYSVDMYNTTNTHCHSYIHLLPCGISQYSSENDGKVRRSSFSLLSLLQPPLFKSLQIFTYLMDKMKFLAWGQQHTGLAMPSRKSIWAPQKHSTDTRVMCIRHQNCYFCLLIKSLSDNDRQTHFSLGHRTERLHANGNSQERNMIGRDRGE